MKALITGVGGFVGNHLARHLLDQGDTEVVGTTYLAPEAYPDLASFDMELRQVELTDDDAVRRLLDETRPDHIYHLAAQSFVPESFESPWDTLSNNIKAQLSIILAMIKLDLPSRLLVVGSAEIYGPVSPDDIPIDEQQPLRPPSPYSVSKVAQDMLGLQYFISHNLPIIRVRPFNQIGPGQSKRFVAPAFASQIAAVEAGQQEPVLYVGNLDAKRDFTDVRDMSRAYRVVMTLGEPGAVYNIGSGQAHSIREVLDILLDMSDAAIDVEPDPARMRPTEVPIFVCNPARIRATTGWEPTYSLEQTLADVLAEWRERVKAAAS